jgi:TP901 family phage tail tape measure protein
MARDTGVAASQVAEIRLQLQGAFGGGDFEASKQFIDDATESALKINKITGLTAEETTDSLTAIAFSFDKTFEEIGDSALGLRDRFGVLAREIITAAADVAPVAAEAGLSFEETSAIVAAAQRAGGRSGSALSEAIGRILPSIPSKAVEILDEFNEANLEDVRTQLVQQIAQGDTELQRETTEEHR